MLFWCRSREPNPGRRSLAEDAELVLDLNGAFLRRTDLSKTSLRRANLAGADFSLASFRGADLRHADLRGTILLDADLTDVRNLTREQLAEAVTVIDEETTLPSYLRRDQP